MIRPKRGYVGVSMESLLVSSMLAGHIKRGAGGNAGTAVRLRDEVALRGIESGFHSAV